MALQVPEHELGFLYNQPIGDISNVGRAMTVGAALEGMGLTAVTLHNAFVTRIEWRKCFQVSGKSNALHEFLLVYLEEKCEKHPRSTVAILERVWDRDKDPSEASVENVEQNKRPPFQTFNSSLDSVDASSHSSVGQAEDRVVYSTLASAENLVQIFLERVEYKNEVVRYLQVQPGTDKKKWLLLTDVLTAAYAVSKARPEYRLFDHNCYYFAHHLFGRLLALIKERAEIGMVYELGTSYKPRRQPGESIVGRLFRPDAKAMKQEEEIVRKQHEMAIAEIAPRMAKIKSNEERVQFLKEELKERDKVLEERNKALEERDKTMKAMAAELRTLKAQQQKTSA